MSKNFELLSKILGIQVLEVKPGVVSLPTENVEFIQELMEEAKSENRKITHTIHIPVLSFNGDKLLLTPETFSFLKEVFAEQNIVFPQQVLGKNSFRLENSNYVMSKDDLSKIEDTFTKGLKNKL